MHEDELKHPDNDPTVEVENEASLKEMVVGTQALVAEAMEKLHASGIGRYVRVLLDSSRGNGGDARATESAGFIGASNNEKPEQNNLNLGDVGYILDLPPENDLPRKVLVNLKDGRIIVIGPWKDQYNQQEQINKFDRVYGPDNQFIPRSEIIGFPHDLKSIPDNWDFCSYVLTKDHPKVTVIVDGASEPDKALDLFNEAKKYEAETNNNRQRDYNVRRCFLGITNS